MKNAALIFGLLAGLLGGVVIALGNLESGLAAVEALGSHREYIAKFALYLIPNLGLLGAGLTLARPRIGGVLLLLSAAAWAGVAFLAGHGAVLFAALPFTFAGAGGLVALFSREEVPEEPEREVPALPPAGRRRDWQDVPDIAPRLAQAPSFRSGGRRGEPDFGVAPPLRAAERAEPPVQRRAPLYEAEEVPPEDYIDAEETFDDDESTEEDAYSYEDAEETSYEEVEDADPDLFADEPIEPDPYADEPHSHDPFADLPDPQDEEIEDEPEPAPPPPRSRRQGSWSLPDPDDEPPVRSEPARQYASERQQPPPSRRQPVPPPPETAPGRRRPPADDEFVFPLPDPAPRRETREPPTRGREPYREFEPSYDAEETRERQGRSPLRRFLRLLIVAVFVLLIAGAAAWIYVDYQRGSQSLLFGTHQATESRPTTAPSAASTPAPPDEAAQAAPTPATAPNARPAASQQAAPPVPAPASDTNANPAPAAPSENPVPLAPAPADSTAAAAPAALTFSDPFRYCQAVDTIDAPDSHFSGPAVPPAVAAALQLPADTPADQVRWRCATRTVMACNVNHSAACDLTPTVDLMIAYCTQHPDTANIPAPNGSWSCNGTRPAIPRDQKWPVDARGFYPGAWTRVAPPAATAGG